MAGKRVNVLVYAGTGSSVESVRNALFTLRLLLSPNYAVSTVTAEVLLNEPWAESCALLVFPGGADLGYSRVLNGKGNRLIKQYVHGGGSYIGFCAGGYYGSQKCEFEVGDKKLEVIGDRELAFFPGTCRGSAFKGFEYNSEAGTRACELRVERPAFAAYNNKLPSTFRTYFNGGSVFVNAEEYGTRGVEVLASYTENLAIDAGKGAAAVVFCTSGEGAVLLTGPHPEFAAANLSKHAKGMPPGVVETLASFDAERTRFMRACLTKLGLQVVDNDEKAQPLSAIHLSSMDPNKISELLRSWDEIVEVEKGSSSIIKGEQDTFQLLRTSTMPKLSKPEPFEVQLSNLTIEPRKEIENSTEEDDKRRNILVLTAHDQHIPSSSQTPSFNHETFFSHLHSHRANDSSNSSRTFGSHLLYGSIVTSTNTLLEKNPLLTSHLPQGTTFTATTQTAGRGRGSNVWLSPPGTLLFSTIIRHPLRLNATAPVVFVQYIAALAVAEGIRAYIPPGRSADASSSSPYAALPVRLKWPNDIYARAPASALPATDPAAYTKIGGILVNSSYTAGDFTLIVGVGLNVANAGGPTTSLAALLRALQGGVGGAAMELEPLLAAILTAFDRLYGVFCERGWAGELERLYYSYWLHSGQVVRVETEGGMRARIVGVTSDWGLLHVEEMEEEGEGDERDLEGTGRMFALQSDSNSFDFFRGLLKRKL